MTKLTFFNCRELNKLNISHYVKISDCCLEHRNYFKKKFQCFSCGE